MPSVTGTQLMTDAFQALNVYMPGDTISANDSTTALRHLNLLVSEWKQQFLTIPAESRNVFPLVSGKGNSTNPYTIGLSGDLNIAKPPNQGSLTGAGLLLNASSPPVEIPRGIMTNDGYDRTRIKDLTSTLFTNVFYLPTYTSDLGQLYLYPVPTDLTNSLVLYIRAPISSFADAATSYSVPDGADSALTFGLARRLILPFGRSGSKEADEVKELARETKGVYLRSNIQMSDLENDFSGIGTGRVRRGYNLQTGE